MKISIGMTGNFALVCAAVLLVTPTTHAQTWQLVGKATGNPVVTANSPCNSAVDTIGVTADRSTLLTCQSGVWKNPAGAGTTVTGGATFATPGTTNWTAPANVTSVSVVCIGGGGGGGGASTASYNGAGGGGGALAWANNIPVTPGTTYSVIVGVAGTTNASGGASSFYLTSAGESSYYVKAGGGGGGQGEAGPGGAGGVPSWQYVTSYGGGRGGNGMNAMDGIGGSGGGAGGYSGNGGNGPSQAGSGGGGAGGDYWQGGGGVNLYGEGASGAAGSPYSYRQGLPGSGGSAGIYGGGGAGNDSTPSTPGVQGACRIIWGAGRAFPSTNVGALTPESKY